MPFTAADYDKILPALMSVAKHDTAVFFDALKAAATNNMSGATLNAFVDDLVNESGLSEINPDWTGQQQRVYDGLERYLAAHDIASSFIDTAMAHFKANVVWKSTT